METGKGIDNDPNFGANKLRGVRIDNNKNEITNNNYNKNNNIIILFILQRPFTSDNRYAIGSRYGHMFYLIFAAISFGLISVLVLFIISYMILKWKRENNGEEYILRYKRTNEKHDGCNIAHVYLKCLSPMAKKIIFLTDFISVLNLMIIRAIFNSASQNGILSTDGQSYMVRDDF